MFNIDEDMPKIDQYLFHGIENKDELIEAIIYYACQESKNKYNSLKDLYNTTKAENMEDLKKISVARYKQLYRFVNLNDKINSFQYDIEDDILKNKISERITKLLETKHTSNDVMISEMINTQAGIYFTRIAENRINDNPWTKEVYKILTDLEKLESEDSLKYYELWMTTKKQRALERKNKDEIKNVELAEKLFQERKEKIIQNQKNGYER